MKNIFNLIKRQTTGLIPKLQTHFSFCEHIMTPEERYIINRRLLDHFNTMENIKINEYDIDNFFKDIQTLRIKIDAIEHNPDISRKYQHFLNNIFNKELINQNNANTLLTNIISTTCLLKTTDDYIWGTIEVLYSKYGKYIGKDNFIQRLIRL